MRVPIQVLLSADEHSGNARDPGPQHGNRRLHIAAARWSTRTLPQLLPRASALDERCSMVDCVPKATRTAPRVPLHARAEKSPLSSVSPRGNGEWRVAPDGEELRAVRCVWSHRPCIELLYRSYMDGFQ